MTNNKPIYHARNVNRWKGSVKPRPFIGLLILDVINRFIFGHGVVIFYVSVVYFYKNIFEISTSWHWRNHWRYYFKSPALYQ